jgi:hypothetical protein
VATFLATPSSANLRTAVTDETGTGSLVFADAPTITNANLVTPIISILDLDAMNITNSNISGSTITTSDITADEIADARGLLQNQRSPLAKAIRVALLASASVRAPQVLDDADIDMGTNNFSVVVQKRITTTRPTANEILYHKHDGTTGIIVTLLTTGIVRLTLNATTFDSTVALTSASNVEPVIIIPVTRETTTTAGSVTFVVDGVQLGTALVISARVEEIVNGTFDTDLTGWTLATGSGGSIAWSSGKMRVTRTGSTTSGYQAISMAAGETLFVSAAATFVSGVSTIDALIVLRNGVSTSSTVLAVSAEILNSASGTARMSYYSATAQTVYLHLQAYSADGVYDFDTVTSLDTYSVDNASNLYLLGTSTTTTEGAYYDGAIYNRALSVTECLAYCLRGPDVADVGGNQTATWTSNWGASVDGFVTITSTATVTANVDGVSDGTTSKDNCLRIDKNATGGLTGAAKTTGTLLPNMKNAWARLSVYIPAGQTYIDGFVITRSSTVSAATTIFDGTGINGQWVDVSGAVAPIGANTSNDRLYIYAKDGSSTTISSSASGELLYIADGTFGQAGITGHWPAFNAQTNTGQLADRSGNKNHMMLPASGATILGDRRPDVQLTWDNTWAATSELQYFPGVNQACYPTNFYFEGIILTPSATTTAGFTIGNGSDADYYATVSGPLTAGVPVFVPLTNRYSDGTNLKLTITPMATTTCTLSTTVFGRLLGGF